MSWDPLVECVNEMLDLLQILEIVSRMLLLVVLRELLPI